MVRTLFVLFVCIVGLLRVPCVYPLGNEPVTALPSATPSSTSYTDIRTHLQNELPTILGRYVPTGWVYLGGLHATSGSMVSAAFAVDAFTSTGNRVTADAAGGTVAINYTTQGCAASDTAWVIARASTASPGAFTRVGTSNLWVDCTTATEPALPPDSAWLMRVTLTGGAITAVQDARRPSSFIRAGVYDVTDPLFGGTGTAASTVTALEAALAAAPFGGTVQIPAGEFLVSRNVWSTRGNITLQGTGPASILKAAPGFTQLVTARALVNFGYSQALGDVPVSNVTVRDVTLDGQSVTQSVFFSSVTNGRIERVTALNAGPTHGSIFVYRGQDVVVEWCTVTGAIGTFGDGIYFESVLRPSALYNTLSDMTRIGIVCEGETGGGLKSTDCRFEGNTVSNLHNATAPESNAAFWMENTNGGWILNNRAYDLTNTPSADASRGITISVGSTGPAKFVLRDNHITDAQYGAVLLPNGDVSVEVTGLRVDHSEETDYIAGVQINTGYHIHLAQIHCGDNTYPNDGAGCVLIDVPPATTVDTITMDSIRVGDTVGGMGYATQSADVNVVSTSGVINVITMRNLQRTRVTMRQPAVDVWMSDSQISHNASTYRCLQASSQLRVSNSTIAGAVTLTPFWFGVVPGSTSTFTDVLFNGVQMSQVNDGSAVQWWEFTTSIFVGNSAMDWDGDHEVYIMGGRWTSYPTTGAITGNGSVNTLRLFVSETRFENATDVVPIQLDTVEPTEAVFTNIQRTATNLTTMTAAVVHMGDPLTFAALGTRADTSLVFCTDCAKATPCAGSGTGALAKRIAGTWDCD